MTEQSLKSCDFQISYGPSDDRLNGFCIPALSRSVRYDRSAGFFSSSALAVAAAGVAHLLKNGGTMRLLVGAEIDDADVAAIQKGHDLTDILKKKFLPLLEDPEEMARRRLEVLAWMVAEGSLQFRVVLPCINGKPLPAYLTHDYYHPKEGIFTDGKGDWIAIPIPEAVRQKLIRFRPERPPGRDPLEDIVATNTSLNGDLRDRVLFQFLRDAPFFPNSDGLCEATAPIVL